VKSTLIGKGEKHLILYGFDGRRIHGFGESLFLSETAILVRNAEKRGYIFMLTTLRDFQNIQSYDSI
jgi:hypothetical protein